ncbi:MAG: SprT family zinc-dependent metalloprotease [Arachnia sp.]
MARRPLYRTQIDHRDLSVEVSWKDIRTLRLRALPPDGRLVASVPLGVSVETVEEFLRENYGWALRAREKVRNSVVPIPPLADGGRVRVWGQWHPLSVTEAARPSGRLVDGQVQLAGPDDEALRRVLDGVYRDELSGVLPALHEAWSERVGKRASRLTLRRMTSRWGSCNTRTAAITLNLALAEHPRTALESVLVHELVHLWERGHGPVFQWHMDALLPDWRVRREVLNQTPPSRFPGHFPG